MKYRAEATSLPGFVQQIAVSYVANEYFFYVTGSVPERKDPTLVDRKLVARYGIDVSKWTRSRRRKTGEAGVQYIRFRRLFVVMATHGQHRFFEDEGEQVRDLRRVPLKVEGYSISYREGRVQVRIEREEYGQLKDHFVKIALRRSAEALADEFESLPYVPYAPVRGQLLCIWRAVNRVRKVAGLELVPRSSVPAERPILRPFGPRGS
jgi:hypothetical protein